MAGIVGLTDGVDIGAQEFRIRKASDPGIHRGNNQPARAELRMIPTMSPSLAAPCCKCCGTMLNLVAGDVIYGDSWFHEKCWGSVQGGIKNV